MKKNWKFATTAGICGSLCMMALSAAAHPLDDGQLAAAGNTTEIVTWANTDENGIITDFGLELPLSMIESLDPDQDPPSATPLGRVDFPAEVQDQTAINHLSIDWEPRGHPPARYSVPHFDFHFYFDTPEGIAAIDCSDLAYPENELVPEGYVLPPPDAPDACVPAMGIHAAPLSDVQSEAPFDEVLILGYYAGSYSFVEPMVTLEHLLARESFDMHVPDVEDGSSRALPSLISFEYVPDKDVYRIELSGFEAPGTAL